MLLNFRQQKNQGGAQCASTHWSPWLIKRVQAHTQPPYCTYSICMATRYGGRVAIMWRAVWALAHTIAHSLICLCSEGESSVVFVGAGEVTYPGVGGCVTFPSWVFHRTGRVVPTGRSMWKLARFGGVAIAKTRSGAEASVAGPRQAADSDGAAASMMQMAGGDARAVGVGAGERRR